jgi:pimeloyl-ACP methyl ester carboxylesterase
MSNLSERGESAATFILVHGSWMGGWAYERIIPALVSRGHVAIARDLPGHGLNASIPRAFLEAAEDREAFAKEPSPMAHLTLQDFVASVVDTIEPLRSRDIRPILVGHSISGLVLSTIAEQMPEAIAQIVYLSAFMPSPGLSAADYSASSENAAGLAGALLRGNPRETGALRMDVRSTDVAYREACKAAYFADLSPAQIEAFTHLLTPDSPLLPFVTPVDVSARRWGSVRRHYIKCAQDKAITLPLQERFIRDADRLTPGNLTRVHTLECSHSAFLSQPAALAHLLSDIAISETQLIR